MKKQEEFTERNPKEIEISNMPDKEFKEMVIRVWYSSYLRVE